MLRIFFTALLALLAGCSHFIQSPDADEALPVDAISYEFSPDGRTVTIQIPHGMEDPGEAMDSILENRAPTRDFESYFSHVKDDSLRKILSQELMGSSTEETLVRYEFREVSSDGQSVTIRLEEDISGLTELASRLITEHERGKKDFHDLSFLSELSLLLPCPDVSVPREANLLPNAPRDYRSGIHRGIDFPAPYGSDIRSVADGVVVRADHEYREITNEFRDSLLAKASSVGYTPSDVFEHILLGRSVFIDHGVELIPGRRLVSIYAHLSEIDRTIQVGRTVRSGQTLGLCGNSGTSDGAAGTTGGAHLHFELIIQDETGEWYMGEGIPYRELVELLDSLFRSEP